jgi:carbamoyl-phosphate synthase large subunit
MGYQGGLVPDQPFTAVKVPVFSWAKLSQVDTYLGPEMKSTGEVMGIDPDPAAALFKAFQAAGYRLPPEGAILATIADKDKEQALPILAGLAELGFVLYATAGTQKLCQDAGIPAQKVKKVREGSPNIVDVLRAGEIGLVINTLTRGQDAKRDGFQIRRAAAEHAVPCVTALDTAAALLRILQGGKRIFTVRSLQEYLDLGGAAIDMAAMSGGHQQAE